VFLFAFKLKKTSNGKSKTKMIANEKKQEMKEHQITELS
jgi:hypothetical protein